MDAVAAMTEGPDMIEQPQADQPEKLDLRSLDICEERQQELLRLFPEARTEGGKIDFDRLKLALGEAVDAGKERYGMSWPGKADCFRTIQAPSLGTLRPAPDESVAFDTSENLIIEGDNLEVLKLLQKSYLCKVKMIYIDPPYNTGNDFIYPDDYTESLQTYLEYTGQVDDQGHRFGTNADTDGRFHSKWLNMMYPRLYLARNLLRDDGVIFISIDDNEVDNLRKVCDDVFGAENFVECFIWKKSYGGGAKEKYAVTQHEYVLMFARDSESLHDLWLPPDPEIERKYYKLRDDKYAERGPYRLKPLEATKSMDSRENLVYPIPLPWGGEVLPKRQWWWSRERVLRALENEELHFLRKGEDVSVSYKQYLRDEDGEIRGQKPFSVIDRFYTQHGTEDLGSLFDREVIAQFPKPVGLVEQLTALGIPEPGTSDIVLDFFAGSGTTAHAALDLNKQDGGDRKFILVQLPEPTGREDYPTIADITKERVRRVIAKLNDEDAGKLNLGGGAAPDRGFRVFKLAESNFKPWDAQVAHDAQALEEQLGLHVDHVREGRSDEDLLYEILLKSGFPLTTSVVEVPMAGKTVYAVADGALFICLERNLTLEVIRTMVDSRPERVVCLDEGFAGNDQLKANAVQIFKTKGVTSFKTV
jgi:adenine-specific DNA-methyltransferase